MAAQVSRWLTTPDRGIVATAGCPDDGRLYVDIGPVSDTRGERVVVFHHGEHIFGRALSDPQAGEHLDRQHRRPIQDRADYWIEFISEDNLAAYLRGERADSSGQPLTAYVRITRAWLMPAEGIPAPRDAI